MVQNVRPSIEGLFSIFLNLLKNFSAEKQPNNVPCAAQNANAKLREKSAENPAENAGWFWQQTALPWWLRLAIWIVKVFNKKYLKNGCETVYKTTMLHASKIFIS